MCAERAVFICDHVFSGSHPILYVVHNDDGDWQFLCGGPHGGGQIPVAVGLNHLIDRDPTLLEVLRLPLGWEAERQSRSAAWEYRPEAAPITDEDRGPASPS